SPDSRSLMSTSPRMINGLLLSAALLFLSGAAFAADPGLTYPITSEVSDQKAGALLVFNTYTSSASAPAQENTRIDITNTSPTEPAWVHLFFVEGASCGIADTFICFTANQTASFTTADADPGTRGYIVALAVDPIDGTPAFFNFLIGDEYVKYATGHAANLGAEAVAKLAFANQILPDGTAASVVFDGNTDPTAGGRYNRLPRV